LLVPVALALYLVVQRRRARYAVRFTNLELLASVVPRAPGWRRHLPTALYLLTLALLIICLARPQATIAVPREQATVLLVIDVSGSMGATDVQPNRLAAAQDAVGAFVAQLPVQYRVGLVTFSDSARLLVDPTTDRAVVEVALSRLRPEAGTAMGDGLRTALDPRMSRRGS
jgi:Ca-activated chloride channel family protein